MTTVSRPVKRKKTNWRRFNWQIFLMAMAGVVFLAIFAYIPMIGIAMAFKNLDYSMNVMKDLMTKPWVGFENFVKFIRDAQFKTVMLNTLSLGVLELVKLRRLLLLEPPDAPETVFGADAAFLAGDEPEKDMPVSEYDTAESEGRDGT